MDAVTLANAVMGILNQHVPFLGGVGGAIAAGAATDVGDTIYQKGKEQGKHLFEAVQDRFAGENDGGSATRALQSFTTGDLDYSSVVQTKLERLLRDDPGFADNLGDHPLWPAAIIGCWRGSNGPRNRYIKHARRQYPENPDR